MIQTIKQAISAYDIYILNLITHNRIDTLSSFFASFSYATSYISTSLILILVAISIIRKSALMRNKAIMLLVVFCIEALLSFILKNTIYRPRPFVTYPFIKQMSEAGSSSFPSGHTLEAFAMATAFALAMSNWKISLLVFLWAFLVAYSRMFLGVHYPTDVLGGMVIGSTIGWSVFRFSRKYIGVVEKDR